MIRFLALLLTLQSGTVFAGDVLVATASNFAGPIRIIAELFEAEGEHTVRIATGSSGKFYAQVQRGAPFDVFLSADQDKPTRLVAEGLAVAESRFTYAFGQLVLISPKQADPKEILLAGNYRRLSIANPRLAPYGQAAERVLATLDVEDAKLVMGENIGQAFQFVMSGNAELGLVARSQAQSVELHASNQWSVPADLYPPIRQDAVLLTRAVKNPAATAFLSFLASDRARAVIESAGYLIEAAD